MARSSSAEFSSALKEFVSEEPPEQGTLLSMQSRGGLINLTENGKTLFFQLEEVFIAEDDTISKKEDSFIENSFKDDVIQNCFFNSTYVSQLTPENLEQCLEYIAKLYFKVRINAKCRSIVSMIRNKSTLSRKEKALRMKLS